MFFFFCFDGFLLILFRVFDLNQPIVDNGGVSREWSVAFGVSDRWQVTGDK